MVGAEIKDETFTEVKALGIDIKAAIFLISEELESVAEWKRATICFEGFPQSSERRWFCPLLVPVQQVLDLRTWQLMGAKMVGTNVSY